MLTFQEYDLVAQPSNEISDRGTDDSTTNNNHFGSATHLALRCIYVLGIVLLAERAGALAEDSYLNANGPS
jgi:hypothetical protein